MSSPASGAENFTRSKSTTLALTAASPKRGQNIAPHSNHCSIQEDDEVIYSYSRAQALADGVLVDVSRMAAEANFRYPTAISADLHARITPNEREKALGQSYEGRLWDILFMAFITVLRQRSADQASFEVGLFEAEADPPHHTHRSTLKLWMVVGPGDQGEPVITIGFPEDF